LDGRGGYGLGRAQPDDKQTSWRKRITASAATEYAEEFDQAGLATAGRSGAKERQGQKKRRAIADLHGK
jgi:hypothetical protein